MKSHSQIQDDIPPKVFALLEQNPDLVKIFADPQFIEKIRGALDTGKQLEDWCMLCGAGKSGGAKLVTSNEPLTADEIESIGHRLMKHAKVAASE